MTRLGVIIIILVIFFTSSASFGEDYRIDRHTDGPFSFSISGVKINSGSTLVRESIIFNDPTCPIMIQSHSTEISYKDSGFRFLGKTRVDVSTPIAALQVRSILYDVFGQHMHNLNNTNPKDFDAGVSPIIYGEWRTTESDTNLLTTVTYVSRVRLADGTQWVFDADNLQLALSSLNLEKKIGEGDE